MTTKYEAIASPRYVVETDGSGERIRIKARRQIFALLFMPIWLAGWTAGGVMAIRQVFENFDAFLLFWLCAWALGWLCVASTIAWMIWGSEVLAVVGRDLEVSTQIGPWSRRKVYRGSEIRDLRAGEASPFQAFRFDSPLLGGRFGMIRYDYGARTIRVGASLEEAEAKMVVERLMAKLPATAR